MKFKKVDPKLQAITYAKTVKTSVIDPASIKLKGVAISDDSKRRKLTSPTEAPLLINSSRPTSLIPFD